MPRFIVHFAQAHENFRLPELEAAASLHKIDVKFHHDAYSPRRPFLLIDLASRDDAVALISRTILVKAVYELWEHADTYDELFSLIKAKPERNEPYMDVSFKFVVDTFNLSVPMKYQLDTINRFSFMAFRGPIDLKTPQATFGVLEDYGEEPRRDRTPGATEHVYFGVLVACSNRSAIDRITLKKRQYLGTTSMDAELSLIMANQAHARPGALVYDPFVGTGSFLVSCAVYGAQVMGSDIDGRQIRGRGDANALSNLKQYGLTAQFLDCFVADVAHHPLRGNLELFDAIVTDPPYGVRAGAKRIAKDPRKADWIKAAEETPPRHPFGKYPQTVPYELDAVMADLTDFAARYLVVGGRLVYWLPTVKSEYADSDVPLHPALRLVANSEQPFGGWSRRLITLEKARKWSPEMQVTGSGLLAQKLERAGTDGDADAVQESKAPAHKGFRQKYFNLSKDE
ncbi:hypothetical protein RI367_000431 [Sorochytrium milnesiophthora]